MKNAITIIIVLALIGFGIYYVAKQPAVAPVVTDNATSTATTTPDVPAEPQKETIIGSSVEDRPITAYHYGTGANEVMFVGGIHGGYSWNTSLVAFELMDYLEENPDAVPANVRVTVIPVLNPDGLNKVVGTAGRFEASDVTATEAQSIPGRFNANNVDLNRNFGCDWKAQGVWQSRNVSGGSEAFSEPEAQAIKGYVEAKDPKAVVVWYSAAGGVFASNCHDGVLSETTELTNAFAKASGYKAYQEFDFYEITGDMVNWLASIEIPAISVLMTNHKDVEWSKNLAGIKAALDYYAE
jgi:hypothetical protein